VRGSRNTRRKTPARSNVRKTSPLLPAASASVGVPLSGSGACTWTLTLLCALPPSPVHTSVNDVVTSSAALDWLPLVALLPLQPPLAVQDCAFWLDQLSVVDAPAATLAGLAVNDTCGAGSFAGATETATVALSEPPGPVQVSVYERSLVRLVICRVPDVARAPLQLPDAVHSVASVLDQLSVVLPPESTFSGFAESDTVGGLAASATVTIAVLLTELPSALLVQVSTKLVFADSGPTTSEPVVALLPAQPPEALHASALVVVQLRVVEPPGWTVVGFAERLAVNCGLLTPCGWIPQIGLFR